MSTVDMAARVAELRVLANYVEAYSLASTKLEVVVTVATVGELADWADAMGWETVFVSRSKIGGPVEASALSPEHHAGNQLSITCPDARIPGLVVPAGWFGRIPVSRLRGARAAVAVKVVA